ncbi:MAG: ribosome biogenesis GTPase Der [Candidatus Peregrinibacteria bacterium]
MPSLPVVAIIGRPNTGKSTLFNRMIGERKAIVSEVAGTTRDHVAHRIEGEAVDYLLLDTGGMGGGTEDKDFEKNVHQQSMLALERADVIVFTINSREELTSSDHAIIDILRKKKRRHVPVLLAATKCDNEKKIPEILLEYEGLGIAEEVIPVSATHGFGTDEISQAIERELLKLHFKKQEQEAPTAIPKIAVIGKPNVGKSSLINALMSEPDRALSPRLVSDIPGTTRDTTDTLIRHGEKEFLFLDTAGIRRRTKQGEGIETFAFFRTVQALEECDIAVLMIDASEPVSHQDQRIAAMVLEQGKGLVVLVNKIDLFQGESRIQEMKHVEHNLSFCRFAKFLPCSALNRDGILKLFPLVDQAFLNRTRRIATKDLLTWYREAVHNQPMRTLAKGKLIIQADGIPPTFVVFVKNARFVKKSDIRYLERALRTTFGFEGTPVKILAKGSAREEKE